ncbi:FecR family protein [Flavobacterium rhizosphaerae]|uniref:FecR family protein n=1 Tax=Flavobacterium rhizosphaerae TaxID=3163298 RepID=A0ABW8YYB2_9FLAO
MHEKDIEKKMQEAWNAPVTQQSQTDKEALWQQFASEAFPAKKKRTWLYPAVAVFVASLAIAAYFTVVSTSNGNSALAYTIIENPSTIIKKVILPDSSVVELEPKAEIRYGENFTYNRNVKLTGEASFSVQKDRQHPFSVNCGETTTTVLGTCFTVNGTTQNSVQVNLYEGSVQMNVKGSKSSWILSPGEEFEYENGLVTVEAFNRFRDFNNTELSIIIAYIKNNYGYSVDIPAEYLIKKITLRLNKKEELENVVGIIAHIYELKPTIDEKVKKITLQ